ncbi:hypothetical protein Hanom_Chr01g00026931 [Helianthus anomalus]
MKWIWATWHVMVEQFADVACCDDRFRWEAISMFHSLFWTRDPLYFGSSITVNLDLKMDHIYHLFQTTNCSQLHIFQTLNPFFSNMVLPSSWIDLRKT